MTTPPPIPVPSAFPAGPPLVLDLGGVEAVSAAGVGELVALAVRLRDSGGRLVLVNVGERAYESLAASRLAEILNARRVVCPEADEGPAREGAGEGVCAKA